MSDVIAYRAVWAHTETIDVMEPYAEVSYEPVEIGETLEAVVGYQGFEDCTPTIEWQTSQDGTTWSTVQGESEDLLSFTLAQADIGTYYRAIVRGVDVGYVTGALEIEEVEE